MFLNFVSVMTITEIMLDFIHRKGGRHIHINFEINLMYIVTYPRSPTALITCLIEDIDKYIYIKNADTIMKINVYCYLTSSDDGETFWLNNIIHFR